MKVTVNFQIGDLCNGRAGLTDSRYLHSSSLKKDPEFRDPWSTIQKLELALDVPPDSPSGSHSAWSLLAPCARPEIDNGDLEGIVWWVLFKCLMGHNVFMNFCCSINNVQCTKMYHTTYSFTVLEEKQYRKDFFDK
jgi:hypothetical protein